MPFVQLLVELLTIIFCCAVDKYSGLERARPKSNLSNVRLFTFLCVFKVSVKNI